jgi:hypothetical protein
MGDLERQLRSFGVAHEQTWGPVDFERLIEAETVVQPVRKRSRGTRTLISIAAAVVTLIVIGLPPLLFGGEETLADSALEWQPVVDYAADEIMTFWHVPEVQVGTDDRFYMMGSDLRLWVSDDGLDWMQYGLETPDELMPLLQPDRIWAFWVGGDMLVLRLAETIGTSGQDGTTIAVYDLSSIGPADADLEFVGSLSLPRSEEQDVAVGSAGVLVNEGPFLNFPSGAAEVWRSADGREWTQVSGLVAITDVTATSEGFYALSGERVDGDGRVLRDLFFSPNGVDWNAVHSFNSTDVELGRWGDQALAVGNRSVWSLSPNGVEHRATTEYGRDDDGAIFGSALGIVQVNPQTQQYLYSPPGSAGQFVDFPQSDFVPWPNTPIAMNRNAVLIGMRSPADLQQPSEQYQLWRGTPESP